MMPCANMFVINKYDVTWLLSHRHAVVSWRRMTECSHCDSIVRSRTFDIQWQPTQWRQPWSNIRGRQYWLQLISHRSRRRYSQCHARLWDQNEILWYQHWSERTRYTPFPICWYPVRSPEGAVAREQSLIASSCTACQTKMVLSARSLK